MQRRCEWFAGDYPLGAAIAPHAHALNQVVFAKAGLMRVQTREGAWLVPPHRALWVPARVEHWISCRTAVAMRTVYLHASLLPGPGTGCAVLAVSPLLRELILSLVEGPHGRESAILALMAHELATTVPVVPLHLPEARDPRLRRACNRLAADPGAAVPLGRLAAEAGASPRTLMRLFQAETSLSFRGWQRWLRLLVALERLAAGERVTTVALDLGYASPSAFTAAFRAELDVTPRHYFRS